MFHWDIRILNFYKMVQERKGGDGSGKDRNGTERKGFNLRGIYGKKNINKIIWFYES